MRKACSACGFRYAALNLKSVMQPDHLAESGSAILFIQDQKTPQQKIAVIMNLVMAERYDKTGQSAGGYYGGCLSQLLLHPVDDAVDGACCAVHDAAAHTVDGIFASGLFGISRLMDGS